VGIERLQLGEIVDFTEIIEDLNLNTRIWSKQ
jgi:hypothetical protein